MLLVGDGLVQVKQIIPRFYPMSFGIDEKLLMVNVLCEIERKKNMDIGILLGLQDFRNGTGEFSAGFFQR